MTDFSYKHFVLFYNVPSPRILAGLIIWLIVLLPNFALSGEKKEIIAGAGPSTKVVNEFVKYLEKHDKAQGYTFEVPEKSAKHAGGIKSTESFIFGRTGRPLNDKEKAMGVKEIFLAKMPIVFVASQSAGVTNLSLDQVCGVFTGKYSNWKEVGGNDGEIVVIRREPKEALFMALKKDLPCMNEITATKVLVNKDHHVVKILQNTQTDHKTIGFGAAKNFPDNFKLKVDGFTSGVNVGLVFKDSNSAHPLVMAAAEIVQSKEWQARLKEMELGPSYK